MYAQPRLPSHSCLHIMSDRFGIVILDSIVPQNIMPVAGANRVRSHAALTLLLLQSAALAAFAAAAESQALDATVWEYEGPACQGDPIMKHYLDPKAVAECKSPDNQPTPGSTSTCQTSDGSSSYKTTCHTKIPAPQMPPPGYLCRVMYNMSPTCSEAASIKQVDCFTLAQAGKCWKRAVSGFAVSPMPAEAGVGSHSMKVSLDAGSLTSGKQYTGPMSRSAAAPSAETVTAYDSTGSVGSDKCGDGSCRCSSLVVRNGECDGFGTKYVW